ncbi:MAG: hypothetical protein DMG28_17055 [Acidobacteria bacterium]|nr:MAG: hypothetical protein DMG28_17055 [Acidobacteriota bacterium]
MSNDPSEKQPPAPPPEGSPTAQARPEPPEEEFPSDLDWQLRAHPVIEKTRAPAEEAVPGKKEVPAAVTARPAAPTPPKPPAPPAPTATGATAQKPEVPAAAPPKPVPPAPATPPAPPPADKPAAAVPPAGGEAKPAAPAAPPAAASPKPVPSAPATPPAPPPADKVADAVPPAGGETKPAAPAASPAAASPKPVAPTGATPPAPPPADKVADAVPPAGGETKPAAPAAPPAAAPPKPAAAVPPKAPAAGPPKEAPPKPEPLDNELVKRYRSRFGNAIREAWLDRKQAILVVDRGQLVEIAKYSRDEEKFDMLTDLTAVDWPKREKRFDIILNLYSFVKNERLRLKVHAGENEPVPSVTGVWGVANWLEREAFDMFGIHFEGHPNLTRILLPEEWQGHPLRKDYDILTQDTAWVRENLGIESGQ